MEIIRERNEIEMIQDQFRPEMRLRVFQAVERLAKGHFAEDVEGDHLVPLRHVQSVRTLAAQAP